MALGIGILDADTFKSVIFLVLLILFASGMGFKIINKQIKKRIGT